MVWCCPHWVQSSEWRWWHTALKGRLTRKGKVFFLTQVLGTGGFEGKAGAWAQQAGFRGSLSCSYQRAFFHHGVSGNGTRYHLLNYQGVGRMKGGKTSSSNSVKVMEPGEVPREMNISLVSNTFNLSFNYYTKIIISHNRTFSFSLWFGHATGVFPSPRVNKNQSKQ